ncbi:chemotaxis protein CheW [Ktedonobacteria bacterium brp13]|nr:chemotaxis protein CheW [Ktedonobacteria bacterium brp13]
MSQHPVLPAALLTITQAHYLEQLDNQQFWHYAQELANTRRIEIESPGQQQEEQHYLVIESESNDAEGRIIIPLASLRQILPVTPHLTQLPASPPWMLGLAAWHGETIAVIDLPAYLAQRQLRPPLPGTPRLLLIAQEAEITLGLTVAVTGSLPALSRDQIQPLDSAMAEAMQHCAHGILGMYAGAPILHMPVILTTMVQHF